MRNGRRLNAIDSLELLTKVDYGYDCRIVMLDVRSRTGDMATLVSANALVLKRDLDD